MRRRTLLALAAWAAGPSPARACTIARVAETPITYASGFPLIALQHAGRTWPFLLDTGAQDMLVTADAAAAMGLTMLPGRSVPVLGSGIAVRAPVAALDGLFLGSVPLPVRSAPVATLPGMESLEVVPAGIIGIPAFSGYDLLFDGLGRRLSLYAVRDCVAVPVPLEPPLTRVPLRRTRGGEMLLTVQLGGVPVRALLDTGARGTVLSPALAGRVAGPGLRVGDDLMPDLRPTVSPLGRDDVDALLGMDYLGRRRVWISYSSDLMVVQRPRGG